MVENQEYTKIKLKSLYIMKRKYSLKWFSIQKTVYEARTAWHTVRWEWIYAPKSWIKWFTKKALDGLF